jgi:hypothetical protein
VPRWAKEIVTWPMAAGVLVLDVFGRNALIAMLRRGVYGLGPAVVAVAAGETAASVAPCLFVVSTAAARLFARWRLEHVGASKLVWGAERR